MNPSDRSADVARWLTRNRHLFQREGDADAIRRENLDPLIRALNVTEVDPANRGKWGKLIKRERTPPHIPHDIIVWKDTLEHFDVFTGTEKAKDTKPAWRYNAPPSNPNWVWLAVDGTVEPDEPDEPEDPPDVPDVPGPDLAVLRHRVEALEALVRALSTEVEGLKQRQLPRLRVTGSSSRVWGHAHSIDLEVTPE